MAHLKSEYGKVRDWWIYKITNPSGKVYIGLTSNIERRKRDYENLSCKNQKILLKSLSKYGFNAHSFEVIDSFVSDTNFAYGKEIFWIRTNMSNCSKWPNSMGLNAVEGGRGSIGRTLSEETKQKLRDANIGKKYSEETKRKLSGMRKGVPTGYKWSDEKKEKMREKKLLLAYRHTDEAKAKIAAASVGNKINVGRKQSKETIAKRVKHLLGHKNNLGRKLSEAHKKAISEGNKGKIVSEETRNKISKAQENKEGVLICQYNLYGNLLQEFTSIRKAERITKISRATIKNQLKGVTLNPKTFIFKYKI